MSNVDESHECTFLTKKKGEVRVRGRVRVARQHVVRSRTFA